MEKEKFRDKGIPEKKIKAIEELVSLINESNSVVIVSIKNLPAKQFQLIKKKLKEQAVIRVLKKNMVVRAIDKIEKGTIKNFKKYLKEDQALIFSKLDPYELSAILSKNKSMARAKIGQKVEDDIVVEPGPTELVPGPVISELGSLGLQFEIQDGKISIRAKKIILKKGEEVSEAAASIMGKLDMKPIAVGLEPVVAYDSKEEKIYEDIKIDQEETIEELKRVAGKALGLAVKIAYVCKDSVGFLLRKAGSEEKVLLGKIKYEKEGIKTSKEEVEEAKKAVEGVEKKEEKGGEEEKKEGDIQKESKQEQEEK